MFLLWVLIRNAWVSDDAFITLRVIENFISGYGPNFNVGERVQVYTHPLWMLFITADYFLFKHIPFVDFGPYLIYYIVILDSLALSLLAVFVFYRSVSSSNWAAVVFGLSVFIFSRSFVHYSTSGLENPLSYLLVGLFFREMYRDERKVVTLALLAGLAILTRQDYLLLFAPYFLYLLASSENKSRDFLMICAGLIPVFLWHLFSLLYYGFPFPNTAYAKLGAGPGRLELLGKGLIYFQDLWISDRLTFLIILLGIILSFLSTRKENRTLGAGILLYLAYILWIGGDFMSGRFFAAPLFLSVMLIAAFERIRAAEFLWSLPIVILLGLTIPHPTISAYPPLDMKDPAVFVYKGQVIDERSYYYSQTGLLVPNKHTLDAMFKHFEASKDQKKYKVELFNDLGIRGYAAGPHTHVIDLYALADPLLARIPSDPAHSEPGHFTRAIPDGYAETLESGVNQISDPSLRLYYDKLAMVVKGDLWSFERLAEIVNFNLGKYDHFIDEYVQRNQAK